MKKTKFFFFIMLCGIIPHLYGVALQQSISVTGIVVDAANEPIPGVTIIVQGTTQGVATDADGRFTLSVPGENATLSFSYIGYVTQTMVVGSQRTLRVVLLESNIALDEVVVVAYGVQKKVSVTGAISTVQTKDLRQSSAANLSSALAGRLPGLTAMQSTGMPGYDNVNLYLRGIGTTNGADPLIMIDGIPRTDISSLDPNEVAAVSILKDASATAVFGVRGANGVVLITTRRGTEGKAELSVTVDQSYQQFIVRADRIHSWEFAELRNQACRNDNMEEEYTPYMIDMYRSGADRVFYPDRDVFHDMFRDWAPQMRVNANLNGGADNLKYFLNIGYVGQGGQFKTEPKSFLGCDASYKMDRYSFRANVDYDIAKSLKLSVNLANYLEKVNSPQTFARYGEDINVMLYWTLGDTWQIPSTDPGPVTVAGYTTLDGAAVPANVVMPQNQSTGSIYGEINRRGFTNETRSMLNSSATLDWDLGFATPGLSARAILAYDTKAKTVVRGMRGYNVYGSNVARTPDEQSYYYPLNTNEFESINLEKYMLSYYYLNFQASLNYARSFGAHNISAMALFQRDNWENQQYYEWELPYNMLGLVGRLTYGYDDRYLAEFNIGRNGSEQFAPDNRFGIFPAFSVGWVVSNEKFLRNNQAITHLKLRASWGKVGNDKIAGSQRFLYLSSMVVGAGEMETLGYGNSIVQGLMGNDKLQWEVATKQNVGLEVQLWKDISLTVDLFKENRDKVLINRGTVPTVQGVPLYYLPKVNMGKVDNQGYEIELSYNKRINSDWSLLLKGNYAYNRNEIIFYDEAKRDDSYVYPYRQTGYSIGQLFGYQIDKSNGNGYINTKEELDNLPEYKIGGNPRLGDFIYKDTNGDGVISDQDMVPIGYHEVPRITYGIAGNVNYKNIDLGFLLSGIAKSSVLNTGNTDTANPATEQGLQGFFSGWHLHAWTQERYQNGEKILYPALSTVGGASNVNQRPNNHFIMDRSYLRLKTVELGYNLPNAWINPIGISRFRIYVSGNNLLTWSKFPITAIDPEQSTALTYPITRMVNVGVNLVF